MLGRIFFLLPLLLQAEEEFISHYEYGQMLYHSPRGVSCAECHGEKGEGRNIVTYKEHNQTRQLQGPDIRSVTYEQMKKSLNDTHTIMPRYYLTDEEIGAIYDYIKNQNNNEGEEIE